MPANVFAEGEDASVVTEAAEKPAESTKQEPESQVDETPAKEEKQDEKPSAEEPKKEESKTEEPAKEESKADESKKDEKKKDDSQKKADDKKPGKKAIVSPCRCWTLSCLNWRGGHQTMEREN